MVIALIFIGVLLFVCGIAFLLKGYRSVPASDSIVPRKDFEELKAELESAKTDGNNLKKQLDTLTIELEQTRIKLHGMQGAKETIKELQSLDEQNKTKIRELDERMGVFMAKTEQQAKDAVEAISTLTVENEGLRKQLQEAAAAAATVDPQALETLKAEKETLSKSIEGQTARIQQLENDLAATKSLQDELIAAKGNLEKLTEENQKLQAEAVSAAAAAAAKPVESPADTQEITAAQQTIEQLQKELAEAKAQETKIQDLEKELQLKQDEAQKTVKVIEDLKAQLQNRSSSPSIDLGRAPGLEKEVARLEDDLARLRQEKVREEVSDLKQQSDAMAKMIEDLKKENKSLLERQHHLESGTPAPREMTAKTLLADIQRSEPKPSGHEPWMQEKKQMEQHLRQLKDFNTHLLEKEKMIQMELTKSRTQAKGLEKICEEFKRQLERTAVRK